MSLFGFSIDLHSATKAQLTNYIELLAKYQKQLIFTSLVGFANNQELWEKLAQVTQLAKKYQMFVYATIDQKFLENYNLTYKKTKELINFFKNKGLAGIKCDQAFDLTTQTKLTYNNQEFKIIINGSHNLINLDKLVLEYRINNKNVISCYNFYQQRYTAASVDQYLINQYESHINNIPFAGFVSDKQGCSLEIHRDWPLSAQIHHLIALGTDVIIVNQFVSETELKLITNIAQKKVTLAVDIIEDISEVERKILFDDKNHFVRPDLAQDLFISPIRNEVDKIKVRATNQEYFEVGDVIICNENALIDCGQLQIVTKRIKNDGIRNLVAKIKEPYRSHFLSELKATRSFKFIA
ncbi:MupG family TIM beta-alpha barrel fold protein [Spiroplasma attinicola]|uniref:MupG family TIM beta-alpha barrel fold protein n=1 Tax=Spiroplasma attinicola TaxID=2904537 RepID=UPI002022B4E9|nr:MupG family TIM beta-alpha barrel fold protein [Spiroplasma sp. JKS002670]MCL8209835.1 hypothetical protein [Spiroplasma sp. JKS002670]